MTWLIWRQHRRQAAFAAGALAIFAILLAVTGVHMAGTYHDALRSCAATDSCNSAGDGLFRGDGAIIDVVNLTLVVPVLLGLFWGAPLLAREIEEGTHKLVWTQSVTRRHWLAAKSAAILAAAALVGASLALAVTWWSRTFDLIQQNRFQPGHFEIQGIVPIGYAILGAALGIAAGAVLRRTLPALAATVGVMVAFWVVVANYVRPHYLGAVTKLMPGFGDAGVGGGWVLHNNLLGPTGQRIGDKGRLASDMPEACQRLLGSATTRAPIDACLAAHGFHTKLVYQPANRFWTFQIIETSICVALALLLLGVAFAVVTRDA